MYLYWNQEKYRSNHNIASDLQFDKAGTKAINKTLSKEYRKADPEDVKRVNVKQMTSILDMNIQ